MAKQQKTFSKRDEIYLVSFDPTVGLEIQKTRTEELLEKVNNTIQISLGLIAL